MKQRWIVIPIALAVAACGPTPQDISTQTAVAQTAIAAAWTVTPSPTATASPTATLTPTNTASPTATDTATPEATDTPASSPTPSETPTSTYTPAPPPTLTFTPVPTQAAPTFASSPIHAWDRNDFAHEVTEVGNTIENYLSFYRDRVVRNNQQGWCTSVWDFHKELQDVRAAYGSDVPADWYALYREYRNLIHTADQVNQIVYTNCPNIQASIYKEGAEERIAQLEGLVAQIRSLSGKVAAMP